MEPFAPKCEIAIMARLYQKPATAKELREATGYSANQLRRIMEGLRGDGLVERIEGTHLMRVIEL